LNGVKKIFVSVAVSFFILVVLYWQVDIDAIGKVMLQVDLIWAIIGLGVLIPITMLTALRLTWLVPGNNQLSYSESLQLTLAASVMNIFLPSKGGDLAKSVFMVSKDGLSHAQALSLVMFEKISDLLALLLWCAVGLFLFPHGHWLLWGLVFVVMTGLVFGVAMLISVRFAHGVFGAVSRLVPATLRGKLTRLEKGWIEMINHLSRQKARFVGIMVYSILLWFLHLVQFWLFIKALNVLVPFIDNLALTPLAILIGLMPFTIAGIGTRDAAFVFIYTSYFAAATGAALGLFATMRYVIVALVGIPFLTRYVGAVVVRTR
jgi:uncharacterized protein (TIRG00374 family)